MYNFRSIIIFYFSFYCQGGPLVALTPKGEIHGLIGIVSFENLLIDAQGFTRIGAFFDWVLSTTGIKTCVW